MEQKTIITPIDKHEVVVKLDIRGRDERKMNVGKLMQRAMKMNGIAGQKQMNVQLTGEVFEQAEDAMISILIASIDGTNTNILERVLDMKGKDYNFVIDELKKVRDGEDFLEKSPEPEIPTNQED